LKSTSATIANLDLGLPALNAQGDVIYVPDQSETIADQNAEIESLEARIEKREEQMPQLIAENH